jgi:hypothetical protein
MSVPIKPFMYWTPRVLGVLFAMFLSLFALDVFGGGYGFWGTMLALLMHLVPVYLVVGALFVAWRWEPVGAILFAALGVAYLVMAWGRFHWSVYALISGPIFLIGALFVVDWVYRTKLRVWSVRRQA